MEHTSAAAPAAPLAHIIPLDGSRARQGYDTTKQHDNKRGREAPRVLAKGCTPNAVMELRV